MKLYEAIAQSRDKVAYRTENLFGQERIVAAFLSHGLEMFYTIKANMISLTGNGDHEREYWQPYPRPVSPRQKKKAKEVAFPERRNS